MANDFAAVEFFLAEQNPQQRAFAAPLRPMKPTLTLSLDGGLGIVEKNLIAVAFAGSGDLQQCSHFGTRSSRQIVVVLTIAVVVRVGVVACRHA